MFNEKYKSKAVKENTEGWVFSSGLDLTSAL